MIPLTGFPSEVSQQRAVGWEDFWTGLVTAWCPYLGKRETDRMHDYSGKRRHLINNGALGGSLYRDCPGGVSWKIATDAYNSVGHTGHGITKSWTSVVVIYHAEGSAFSTRWPDFRDTHFMLDSGNNIYWGVKQNTDQLWLKAWTGAAYNEISGATTLPFKQLFVGACRVSELDGLMRIYLDGKQDNTMSFTQGNSLSGTTLNFHGWSAGEYSPHHLLAHYTWNVAKPEVFIRRISRDWAGPFRIQQVRGKAPAVISSTPAVSIGGRRISRNLLGVGL